MLVAEGYSVLEAQDGQEAVTRYRSHHPDAVLLDINMPGLDGLSALKKIRQYDPGARVAMVTALGYKDEVTLALRAGAVDFVVKPYHRKRILAAVRKLLREE
jgi:two-component system chemotaxis response regulator CheY